MSDELNVWDAAFIAWDGFPTDPSKIGDADHAAAAVIRTYGDERHAAGYQAAIADVVEWLGRGGASTMPHMVIAGEITRRFGKGQDHG